MEALPTGVCGLGRLSTIDLSNNKLRSLPPELGESTSLTRLELSNNELSSLPPSLGMLRQLTVFHLQVRVTARVRVRARARLRVIGFERAGVTLGGGTVE